LREHYRTQMESSKRDWRTSQQTTNPESSSLQHPQQTALGPKRRHYVFFADSSGYVFLNPQYAGDEGVPPTGIEAQPVGSVFLERDALFVVDREPSDAHSQLHPQNIVRAIKSLFSKKKDSIERIVIHLPRIAPSMYREAQFQNALLTLHKNVDIIQV